MNKFKLSGREWTKQRQACYEYFITLSSPADAENIWLQLKMQGVALSRETVYNTLHLLVDLGFAERRPDITGKVQEYLPVKQFSE